MRPVVLPFLFACATILPAQQPGPAAQLPPSAKKPQPTGRITGQVLCGDTRRPARGAVVFLEPLGAKEAGFEFGMANGMARVGMARVGMDGTYQISHVAAGSYAVIAMLPGYLSPIDGLETSGSNKDSELKLQAKLADKNAITVPANGAVSEDLVLERGAAISGRVLYPDGSPATQVSMVLEDVKAKPVKNPEQQVNLGSMFRTIFTRQSTVTDDQGHFRVSGIAPGTYRLAAVPPVSSGAADGLGIAMMMGMAGNSGAVHVYVGNSLHRSDAKTFELRSGEEIGDLQITLPIDTFHTVGGVLTAKDGRLLSLATLTLTDSADDSLTFKTSLGENGIFRFPSVPPGTYQLTAAEGRIVTPNPNMQPIMARQTGTPIAAFADGSIAVLVKDSDLTDVSLALDETALKPAPKPTADDDGEPD